MLKWLTIIVGVMLVFFLIMLGLGALLHDNEERVVAIKEQLAENKTQLEALAEQKSIEYENEAKSNTESEVFSKSTNIAIIARNLTCVSDEQCHSVNVRFADLTCQLAINTIGKAQLNKAPADKTNIHRCPVYQQPPQAVCRDNLCTLSPSG